MRGLSLVFEVTVKILIALAVGFGVSLLTFGIVLVEHGALNDFDALENQGPPLAETFIACGAGLLSMALTLLLFSVGPFSRKRWFAVSETSKAAPEDTNRRSDYGPPGG